MFGILESNCNPAVTTVRKPTGISYNCDTANHLICDNPYHLGNNVFASCHLDTWPSFYYLAIAKQIYTQEMAPHLGP